MKCESNGCIQVDVYGEYVRIRSTQTGMVMQAAMSEWQTFLQEAKEGFWDVVHVQDERSFECPTK